MRERIRNEARRLKTLFESSRHWKRKYGERLQRRLLVATGSRDNHWMETGVRIHTHCGIRRGF